jgi:membrane protease subunit (stomatin/prohibitin family)
MGLVQSLVYTKAVAVPMPVYTHAIVTAIATPSRHTQLRVATDGSSSSNSEDSISFDKSIYRILSMQDDMKVLQVPTRIRSEFDRFLYDAINKTNRVAYNSSFDSLDEYIGTIGVTNGVC